MKVRNIKEITNFDGKRKYLKEYGTSHSIGRIQLVYYGEGSKIPHIEYKIFDEFKELRNKGIMSKELPKYLKYLKKYEHKRCIAIIKHDNEYKVASSKLLQKNGFIKFDMNFKNFDCYLFSFDLQDDIKYLKIEDLKNRIENLFFSQENPS